MTDACPGSIFQLGVTIMGTCAARFDSSRWTWYLNATAVREICPRLTKYSPDLDGVCVTKVGFGATFSRTGKFSSRMFSDLLLDADSEALCASATSPMTTLLVTCPAENHALTVSTTEALSPASAISGCFAAAWMTLVAEWADRTECESDPCCASEDREFAFPVLKVP